METQNCSLCQNRSLVRMTENSYHERNIQFFINLSYTELARGMRMYTATDNSGLPTLASVMQEQIEQTNFITKK